MKRSPYLADVPHLPADLRRRASRRGEMTPEDVARFNAWLARHVIEIYCRRKRYERETGQTIEVERPLVE